MSDKKEKKNICNCGCSYLVDNGMFSDDWMPTMESIIKVMRENPIPKEWFDNKEFRKNAGSYKNHIHTRKYTIKFNEHLLITISTLKYFKWFTSDRKKPMPGLYNFDNKREREKTE